MSKIAVWKKTLLHRKDLTKEGTTAYAVHMHSDFPGVCYLEAAF